MTAKQTALRNMAKMVALALIVGSSAGLLIMTVPVAVLGIGSAMIMFVCLAKMIYDLELSKAEYRETLIKLKQDLAD